MKREYTLGMLDLYAPSSVTHERLLADRSFTGASEPYEAPSSTGIGFRESLACSIASMFAVLRGRCPAKGVHS